MEERDPSIPLIAGDSPATEYAGKRIQWRKDCFSAYIFRTDGLYDTIPHFLTEKFRNTNTFYFNRADCFTANYIIGVGLLGVPNAFYKAGLGLSTGTMLGGTLVSLLTIIWLIEIISRSQAMKRYQANKNELASEDPLLFELDTSKLEINELLGVFVGNWAKTGFTVLLGLFIYITLWSYTAVFASSLLSLVPFPGISTGYSCDIYNATFPAPCEKSYLLYVLLFLLIVTPLMCMDLTEQAGMQIFLCLFRFAAILLMFITSMIAMFQTPYNPNEQSPPPYVEYKTLVNFKGFGTIFPTAIFSQMLHHSIPGLVQPVANKKHVRWMFCGALMTTFSLYVSMGVPTAMYFGSGVKPVISLNWKDYSGLGFEGPTAAPVWATLISYTIVLFPVLDIVSAFPLNGITLGNTMFAALPEKWQKGGKREWVKIATRLAVVFPPIILGSFIKRLDVIIEIAGTVGFFIAFIVPGLLQLFSIRRTKAVIGTWSTPYSVPVLSSPIAAVLMIIFGFSAFIYQCVNIGMNIANGTLKM